MFRWTHIGIGIHSVQQIYRSCQRVFSWKFCQAKILTGGIQQEYHCGYDHGKNEIAGVPSVRRIIPQEQPQMHTYDTEIPQHIGNEKHFLKGNYVIQRAPYRMIFFCRMESFNKQIPQQPNRPEQEIQRILFRIISSFQLHVLFTRISIHDNELS